MGDEHRLETLRFLLDKRMDLFNVRRDHEWKIFFGTVGLIGGVVALLVTKSVQIPPAAGRGWGVALGVLFAGSFYYQMGVQRRNRVDRIAMDALYHRLCDAAGVPAGDVARVSIDCEGVEAVPSGEDGGHRVRDAAVLAPRILPLRRSTYLWAFIAQHALLLVACVVAFLVPSWVSPGAPPPLTTGEYLLVRPRISVGDGRAVVVERWGDPANTYVDSGTRDTVLEYRAPDARVKVTIRGGRVARVENQPMRNPELHTVRTVYY